MKALVGSVLPQISRYSLVSAAALGLDFAVFLALLGDGLSAPSAGMIGYALGTTVHFVLSTRHVFDRAMTMKSDSRLFGEFALSGLIGLAITAIVVAAAVNVLGFGAFAGKGLAAMTSFIAVFSLRRAVVFVPRTGRLLERGAVSR